MIKKMDFTKDIYINKDTVYEDSEIVLLYKGFLFSNNLTKEIYISYGYGKLWKNKSEIKMRPSAFGYITTVKVESGDDFEFCFRDSEGVWDNNSGKNYILPIKESESFLSFKPIVNSAKEISFEIKGNDEENEAELIDIFETSIISSSQVELYQTIGLDNIEKQTIPDNTLVTQVKLDSNNQNIISSAVIKTPEPEESVSEVFTKLTEQAKEQSVKAFDEGKVTAGSIYVNSLTSDVPKTVENITDKKTLIMSEVTTSEKAIATVQALGQTIKLAFTKFIKLIKTALNLGESKD